MLGHEEVSNPSWNGDLWYQSYHAMLPANEGLLPSSLKIHGFLLPKINFKGSIHVLPVSSQIHSVLPVGTPNLPTSSRAPGASTRAPCWARFAGTLVQVHQGAIRQACHTRGGWSSVEAHPAVSNWFLLVQNDWDTSYQKFILWCFFLVLRKTFRKFSMDTELQRNLSIVKPSLEVLGYSYWSFRVQSRFLALFWETQATVRHHSCRWWRICTTNISVNVQLGQLQLQHDMSVSKNRATPKWMVYNGKPY